MGTVKTVGPAVRTARARDLRRRDTRAEAHLWQMLRARRLGGWKWKRQVPFGPFILDFLCVEAGLLVELDGGQHADQLAYDTRRASWLSERGLRVMRFWNSAALTHRDGVCRDILLACGGERRVD